MAKTSEELVHFELSKPGQADFAKQQVEGKSIGQPDRH